MINMEASMPKYVNVDYMYYGVNSLRLESLQIINFLFSFWYNYPTKHISIIIKVIYLKITSQALVSCICNIILFAGCTHGYKFNFHVFWVTSIPLESNSRRFNGLYLYSGVSGYTYVPWISKKIVNHYYYFLYN